MLYIWRTVSLANWNVMEIDRHLVWQKQLIQSNRLTIIINFIVYARIQ